MDFALILGAIAIAATVLFALAAGRMAWRVLRGDEEMEPGGSFSRQTVARYKKPDEE